MGIVINQEKWAHLQTLGKQDTRFVQCLPVPILNIQEALLHYALCDVWLALPVSEKRNQPYWLAALSEALAMETLAIVPTIEETRQIAQYGRAVFLVDKDEMQEYRQALEYVLTLMPSERTHRKREARQQLQRTGFTLEETRRQLHVLLSRVLQPATKQDT